MWGAPAQVSLSVPHALSVCTTHSPYLCTRVNREALAGGVVLLIDPADIQYVVQIGTERVWGTCSVVSLIERLWPVTSLFDGETLAVL